MGRHGARPKYAEITMKNYWLDRKEQRCGVIIRDDGYFDLSLVSSNGTCANCGATSPHSCVPKIETFITDTITPCIYITDTILPTVQIDVTPQLLSVDTVWGTLDLTTQPFFVSWEATTVTPFL